MLVLGRVYCKAAYHESSPFGLRHRVVMAVKLSVRLPDAGPPQ